MDPEKKPTIEDIEKLKANLYNELNEHKCFQLLTENDDSTQFEVTGGFLNTPRAAARSGSYLGRWRAAPKS